MQFTSMSFLNVFWKFDFVSVELHKVKLEKALIIQSMHIIESFINIKKIVTKAKGKNHITIKKKT